MSGHSVDIVGHRGARGEAPENTLVSFQRAIDAGVRAIELDVRITADGHLVVLHDAEVDRTTWHSGPAHGYTLAEIGLLDARRNTPGWPSPVAVPSLERVIEHCPADTHFQLEVKASNRNRHHQLAQALKKLIQDKQLRHRVVVTSSHTGFLRVMRHMDPGVALGYVGQYRYQQPLRRASASDCKWLIAHFGIVNRKLVKQARHRGLKISVWTVNDIFEAERLKKLKVDSIITDFPTRFMEHFGGRPEDRHGRHRMLSSPIRPPESV